MAKKNIQYPEYQKITYTIDNTTQLPNGIGDYIYNVTNQELYIDNPECLIGARFDNGRRYNEIIELHPSAMNNFGIGTLNQGWKVEYEYRLGDGAIVDFALLRPNNTIYGIYEVMNDFNANTNDFSDKIAQLARYCDVLKQKGIEFDNNEFTSQNGLCRVKLLMPRFIQRYPQIEKYHKEFSSRRQLLELALPFAQLEIIEPVDIMVDYMDWFRTMFPDESITPRMKKFIHIAELVDTMTDERIDEIYNGITQ